MTAGGTAAYEGTAINGLFGLLYALNKNPAPGTGILKLIRQGHNQMGTIIAPVLVDYTSAFQFNLFGEYPQPLDVGPSALFVALFSIAFLGHLTIFIINSSRGHKFPLSLGFAFYCLLRIIGFALRIVWSADITKVQAGIADEVFLIVSNQTCVSLNLILAQRIFTWRHPVGGSRRLFWNFMIALYIMVVLIMVMTIFFAATPYTVFLSESMYQKYIQVNQASSVLIVAYSLTSASLIGLAYFFKPTRKDENLYTYQPWWIESFKFNYFVKSGAEKENAIGFMKRNRNHRHAIRVIAATHHHYNMVEGLTNQRGTLKHNYSIGLLCVSTVIIFLGSLLRCVVVFQQKYAANATNVGSRIAMYIFWGAGEFIVMMMYLFFRVDLRFYRPNRLPKEVRSIITANQSVNVSDVEESDNEGEIGSNYEDSDSETNVDFRPSEKKLQSLGNDDDDSEFRF